MNNIKKYLQQRSLDYTNPALHRPVCVFMTLSRINLNTYAQTKSRYQHTFVLKTAVLTWNNTIDLYFLKILISRSNIKSCSNGCKGINWLKWINANLRPLWLCLWRQWFEQPSFADSIVTRSSSRVDYLKIALRYNLIYIINCFT